ncbi:ArdC-like ssDNA-binding domain-containing protein [Haladaptatus sp. AB643]|uniref:ArdC-like ssDNA-binding domain-containing protein n=1 Tax=Haladaptatus sp. AB643 TaxID=2934174 RepID=UPI00209BF281|nr:ArdC-like ssDNA-binding domain-containing protein [Haladaptatus sp. AB643]MCO8242993.1 ImmA/IrrE family metallo-endopeptidase [Haladaptatus sp. AB643]
MATSDSSAVSFDDSDTRRDQMHSTIETWIDDLVTLTDEARASQQFQAWLDVQSQFHNYSHRNTLLINLQCPEATKVAGYNTWQSEFGRHVQEGEQAIWIWAPVITKQCPECENSPSYHESSECVYDGTPPDEWSKGLVGFKPAAIFDISQTEGKPLPELETEAIGNADSLVPALLDVADDLNVTVNIVDSEDWEHGDAKGVCKQRSFHDLNPVIEVKARTNQADLAVTLVHEYAHALLHFDVKDVDERSKREVEAEAVAYVVGRYFELDTNGSAFYLAAWQGEQPETVTNRLGRIRHTANEIITNVREQSAVKAPGDSSLST